MKVRKIDIEKNRIELTHKGQEYFGTFSAFCGKLNRVLQEGELICGRYAVWYQTNPIHMEPAFSHNGPGSYWKLNRKGCRLLARAGINISEDNVPWQQ